MSDAPPSRMKGDVKVTAYRDAARRYCAMVGANPDDEIPTLHPTIANVHLIKPRWYLVAEQMLDLSRMMRAIQQAAEAARAANDPVAGTPAEPNKPPH